MRKRHSKRQKRTEMPLWKIVAGVAIVLAAAFFVLRQGAGSSGGGTPRISVDQQRVDYGYVKLGETRTINILVTNTGDGVLRFKKQPYIEVLEGCCPPELSVSSTTLEPGETATVRSAPFMMHEGMDGPHNFGVHLLTNDPSAPDFMVNLLSDWGP